MDLWKPLRTATLLRLQKGNRNEAREEFMGRWCRLLFSKLLDRPASDASAGRTSTAACSPLLPMPISTRWESRTRLRPTEVTQVLNTTTGINDQPDDLGLADIDHFAQFIRGTMVPPRDVTLAATPAALKGQQLFRRLGCSTCHVETIITAPPGTVIDGGQFTVPEALGDKIIHPFGDYLLHDIGTGDGIVQVGPQDTANKLRTAPLWGVRTKSRFMHDLASLSLENAIARHQGEATEPARIFGALSAADQGALITFLNSL